MTDTGSTYDLVIRAGRVCCSATGLDGPGSVAVQGDRIAAAGPEVSARGRKELDFPDAVLLPGLIDLHAHPAIEGSKYGIDPDVHILPRGVTTVLSQGDAGASNWPRYRETIIESARTRVRLAINLAASGESSEGGCFEDMDDVDVDACVGAIEDGGGAIWGIAVNISAIACGENDPEEIMNRALEAAGRTRCPLLFGTRRGPDLSLSKQLEWLRPGDVVTYCYHGDADRIVDAGSVRKEVWEARERGILFDVGHGMKSFDFAVAEAAIADGFLPDTISSDQYLRHVGSHPQHDLPRTMSKLIAVGMSEADAFVRVTARPAEVLGLEGEVGTLAPGACADLAVVRWNPDAAPLTDATGAERAGGCWEPVVTVRAGEEVWSYGGT
jgi:dihydroorotase